MRNRKRFFIPNPFTHKHLEPPEFGIPTALSRRNQAEGKRFDVCLQADYLQQQDIEPAFLVAFFLAGAFLATFLAVAFLATFLAGAFLATFFATFLATVVPPLKVRGLADLGNFEMLKFPLIRPQKKHLLVFGVFADKQPFAFVLMSMLLVGNRQTLLY